MVKFPEIFQHLHCHFQWHYLVSEELFIVSKVTSLIIIKKIMIADCVVSTVTAEGLARLGSECGPSLLEVHFMMTSWKHFPCYWPFVRGIHRSPVKSPHKGQWRRALIFSLICTWTNGWVKIKTPLIWDIIALIMTSLLCHEISSAVINHVIDVWSAEMELWAVLGHLQTQSWPSLNSCLKNAF